MRPANWHRVNINDPLEVDYWCKKLGCNEKHLRMAVKRDGVMVGAVKRALERFRLISNGETPRSKP